VGDYYLTPGWTSYNKRLQYQTYDVTNLITQGKNAIGVTLGDGWYRGTFGYKDSNNLYGKDLSLLLQLHINYEDGTSETVLSDESWKSSTGAIRYSEIYNGETQDARKEQPGWTTTNFDDSEWSSVRVKNHTKANLVPTENEPVKKQEVFKPVKIVTTPEGDQVIDFGQNLVGWVVVKAKGKAGDKIVLSHAEVLDKKGNFYTANLRLARQQNTYILNGGAEETFEPHFTWQGFRYVKVEGVAGELKPENFTAVALYSDMTRTGNFTCSNPLVNQLQHNIEWSQKGNFIDIPTDCRNAMNV
jgi:alpha-L-rhamnosidase